jgi:hypothetical protein
MISKNVFIDDILKIRLIITVSVVLTQVSVIPEQVRQA